uniref:Uncharacterized protein n=1 Tax=Rhizophora mucronata TaxID=61149 RepID=A0A2P2QUA4_RHIMU
MNAHFPCFLTWQQNAIQVNINMVGEESKFLHPVRIERLG